MSVPHLPFPLSLCHRCTHVRYSGNKRGSVFIGCGAEGLPKYSPQPVVRCAGYLAQAPKTADDK